MKETIAILVEAFTKIYLFFTIWLPVLTAVSYALRMEITGGDPWPFLFLSFCFSFLAINAIITRKELYADSRPIPK